MPFRDTSSRQSLMDSWVGPVAQAVLPLHARDLRWGMLTGGARWRLVDARSLRRYEHTIEVDLDALTALEAKLAEVRCKIRLTDDLIDQIVYKLYGLTEEEADNKHPMRLWRVGRRWTLNS